MTLQNSLLLFQLLAVARILPTVLFLLQYRGRLFEPIALMLRGLTLMAFIRAVNTFVILWMDPQIGTLQLHPIAIGMSLVESVGNTALMWFVYLIFLRYRRRG